MDFLGMVVSVILGGWLISIAWTDLRSYRIPDRLSLPLIAAGLLLSPFLSQLPFAAHLTGAAAGYLALAAVGQIFFMMRGREGLGLGDAKLLGAAGAWTGWSTLPFILLLAALGGLLYAFAVRRAAGDGRIAFGPHLAAGFWLVWVLGAPGQPPIWR